MLCASELGFRFLLFIKSNSYSPQSFVYQMFNTDNNHLDNSNTQRMPYPYIMFKGKPNHADHNSYGFRFDEDLDRDSIKVALFGGSTGYQGDPPIINLLSEKLTNERNTKFEALNFSVISSNHNQHVHAMIEVLEKFKVDLVIFYGGYNETLQPGFYDPRPGYPYNFFYRNELPPEIKIFLKHSQLLTYLITKIDITKIVSDYDGRFTTDWNKAIVENYINSLRVGEKISKSFTSGKCSKSFISIYQPYKLNDPAIPQIFKDEVHKKIKKLLKSNSSHINISESLNNMQNEFTDIVHVSQKANKKIAEDIYKSNVFQSAIDTCFVKVD